MVTEEQLSAREQRTVSSMLWAAWADALGFISELTDDAGLHRRLGGRPLEATVAWRRKVGGRGGVVAELPAGCYSDDTQLRLATARAISGNGFDVEAFAHVELPVWPAYALGGGRASKAAAANLSRSGVPWYGNFYKGWFEAGGNGAAMRIQPHVWAAAHPMSLGPHLIDVIVNAASTHGHPRALVGAVLHALAVGAALEHGEPALPAQWPALLDMTEQAVKLLDEHPQLASTWRPSWEKATNASFAEAWRATVAECRDLLEPATHMVEALRAAPEASGGDLRGIYEALVLGLGLSDERTLGSGTATVIAALALSAGLPSRLYDAIVLAARTLGTDTDTIATMTAAITAAAGQTDSPPSPVLDHAYLAQEARRLAQISEGRATPTFSYPDLLDWVPPRTQIDAVGQTDTRTALAGLGWLEPTQAPIEGSGANWQWMSSDFGPSFLVKQRAQLKPMDSGNQPVRRGLQAAPETAVAPASTVGSAGAMHDPALEAIEDAIRRAAQARTRLETRPTRSGPDVDIDDLLRWVADGGYIDPRIGRAVTRIAQVGTLEQYLAFTTALRDRLRRAREQHDMEPGRRDIDAWLFDLSPVEFERVLQRLFRAMGYVDWHRQTIRDDGIDAIALHPSDGKNEVVLIQLKRYRRTVPVESVQALAGVLPYESATRGVIVATSGFGKSSYEFAERAGNIDLIDGRELRRLLERFGHGAQLELFERPFRWAARRQGDKDGSAQPTEPRYGRTAEINFALGDSQGQIESNGED